MRAFATLLLCVLTGSAGQVNQDDEAPRNGAPVQAVMPRQYITPTISQLEVGERGWINCKALVVDDRFRCWLVKAAHVHDTAADAGSSVEVARTQAGWRVFIHLDYKWKTIPEAGLATDCYPVGTLTFVAPKQAKK